MICRIDAFQTKELKICPFCITFDLAVEQAVLACGDLMECVVRRCKICPSFEMIAITKRFSLSNLFHPSGHRFVVFSEHLGDSYEENFRRPWKQIYKDCRVKG
jgi:hypothetical protein